MKPDLTPFYVGKGKDGRCFDFIGRTDWHRNIVKKYGKENIIIESQSCASENEAFFRERTIIKSLRASGIKLVNLSDGGEGSSGYKFTKSQRLHLSKAQKERYSNPSERVKLGLSLRGLKRSDESKRRYSEAKIGKYPSAETRKKQSEIAKSRSHEAVKFYVSAMHSEKSLAKKQAWWISEKLKDCASKNIANANLLPNATIGTVWINNGVKNMRVRSVVVEGFLLNGWVKGQLRKNTLNFMPEHI